MIVLRGINREEIEKVLSEKDIVGLNEGDRVKAIFPNGDFMIYKFNFVPKHLVIGLQPLIYGKWESLEYHSEYDWLF